MEINNKNRFELSGTVTEINISEDTRKPSKVKIRQVNDNGYESIHEVSFFQSITFQVNNAIEVTGRINTYRNESQNGSIFYNLSLIGVGVKLLTSTDSVPF